MRREGTVEGARIDNRWEGGGGTALCLMFEIGPHTDRPGKKLRTRLRMAPAGSGRS